MAASVAEYKPEDAVLAAEKFSKIYYEAFDNHRQTLTKLYMANAKLVWNGNACEGCDRVLAFFAELPSSATHLDSLDCQPLREFVTQGQTCITVTTMGNVKFRGNPERMFFQTFLLASFEAADSTKSWKIVSDCFRFID